MIVLRDGKRRAMYTESRLALRVGMLFSKITPKRVPDGTMIVSPVPAGRGVRGLAGVVGGGGSARAVGSLRETAWAGTQRENGKCQ